ncbi:MAG TPA: hypothetical protein VG892_00445, partial [Terriglobales bacterium]|nr:hypothetical protein [Terriglobales bacterium]
MPPSHSDSGREGGRERLPLDRYRDPRAAALNLGNLKKQLSPSLFDALTTLVADVPDPDSALNLFERLISGSGSELVQQMDRSRALLHYALLVFGHSSYLGETLIQNADLLQALRREGALARSHTVEEFREAFARFRSRSFDTETALLLARFKRREYVRIMLRDVLGITTLAETTAEISALADVMIEEALREVESSLRNRYGTPQHRDSDGRMVDTQCAVLSLGKLGGNELNYSSDIDLLFLYDDGPGSGSGETEPVPEEGHGNREWFVRLAQQVTELLSRMTSEGFAFRVDLRLRPQGGEGELAVGLHHAIRYYSQTAHDWERQAMIKIRHSAGDISLARSFIRGVQPFVYTEEVNFAAIETALEARDRISRHRASSLNGGIDVKLNRGGIRDIEFLVQCLQRVYGGQEPWLRSGGTLFSLAKLHDRRHISGRDFQELTVGYEFLRNVEHRLQLRQGQQTHRLPQSRAEIEVISRALRPARAGEPAAGDLVETVNRRMATVVEIYNRILHHQRTKESSEVPELSLESTSDEPRGERTERAILERLEQEAPDLRDVILGEPPTSHTRHNLMRFLAAAFTTPERHAAVISACTAVPKALDIFRLSDFLTDILVRHPEEIATLQHIYRRQAAADKPLPGPAPDANSVQGLILAWVGSSNLSNSQKLGLLRSHYCHCVFTSGAHDLLQPRNIHVSLLETSAAADAAINAALAIAGQPEGLSILALGRLGTQEFDLLSDADLLFVRDESLEITEAQRTAQQVVQALSSYTRKGTVFPVDARLRPHGAEGELVMTPALLESYFKNEALPWEALTFTKLRHVAGSEEISQRAIAGVNTLVDRFASDRAFVPAVMEMRSRIESAAMPRFGQQEAYSFEHSLKSGPGGIYDTDFLVGTLTVLHGLQNSQGIRGNELRGNLKDRIL